MECRRFGVLCLLLVLSTLTGHGVEAGMKIKLKKLLKAGLILKALHSGKSLSIIPLPLPIPLKEHSHHKVIPYPVPIQHHTLVGLHYKGHGGGGGFGHGLGGGGFGGGFGGGHEWW